MNNIGKIFAATAMVAGSLCASAHAGTITFGSTTASQATTGFDNEAITSPGNTVVASTIGYGNALAGTQYVTYQDGAAPPGTTDYFTNLDGNLAGYGGSISVFADDLVTIKLNGTLVGTTTGPYNQLYTFGIPTTDFLATGNVLEFDVTNSGTSPNPTAIDFLGTAATPEPSSLILLGSGLVSAAGMVIRKRRA